MKPKITKKAKRAKIKVPIRIRGGKLFDDLLFPFSNFMINYFCSCFSAVDLMLLELISAI